MTAKAKGNDTEGSHAKGSHAKAKKTNKTTPQHAAARGKECVTSVPPPADSVDSSTIDLSPTIARKLFERNLLITGEAAEKVNGELPPGATHKIKRAKNSGEITIERERFSLY